MNYTKTNNVTGWAVFAVAAYTFLSTIEPTASFWDCGEYIATAFKLQVGHPPGAPLFQMLGRFFCLFAGSDVTQAAKMVNIMSALSSAFTILFLFWSITALARKIAEHSGEMTDGKMLAVMGSGAVGALAYAFSDSFWFSAVEGEVYAMSSMFTAMVFWAILKWERVCNEPHAERWIIFIAYLFGLSVGVHLLNLLAIPAIVFIYYFKKFEVNNKGFVIAGILSVIILGGIQAGVIPGIVNLAGNFELFFVNTVSLPYNSGTVIYSLLLVSLIVIGLMYTHNESDKFFNYFMVLAVVFFIISLISSPTGSAGAFRFVVGGLALVLIYTARRRVALLNTIILSFTVLLIGYSSFVMLVIRSNANTPMNENAPQDAISLLSYLNREQYGDWPVLYGQYYNSPLDPQKPYSDGTPVYIRAPKASNGSIKLPAEGGGQSGTSKEKDHYIISDDRASSIPNYDPEYCTIFPRMWSSQSNHEAAYRNWGGIKRDKTTDAEGHETPVKPTFGENLTFFVSYQLNWMFWRYFLWNYVGRQNDVQGHSNATDGNWITGFKSFDQWRLGAKGMPESYKTNKANNAFYALPLLLGIIGMFFHFNRHNKDAFVVLLLFFFTGLAIIVYLNQYPYQPRERDYAYAGATYAFAIWIGIGVFAIFDWIGNKIPQKAGAILATVVCLIAVPAIMAKNGWDDHDRSNRYTARDFAKDYLDSCAPNAILFTNGDNDTFPLWYVQEVEGYRTDVRVCNLSLLNTDWYINQMKRKAYDSDPMPLSLNENQYRQGTRDYVPFYDRKIQGYISVRELIDFVSSEDPQNKLQAQSGKDLNYFPTKKMSIPVDSAKVLKNGTVLPADANRIVKSINWDLDKSYVLKNDLMVLDLLATNNWERPIYFAVTTGPESYLNLQDYFQLEGLAYRLVPVKASPQEQQVSGTRVATDIMYNNVMKFSWGGMDKKGVYLDENIQRMCTNLRIQLGTLATTLLNEGKKDKAMNIVDKCLEVMPEENVPYDATIYQLVMTYYQLGANDKANKVAKRLFDIFESDMNYYISLGQTGASAYGREMRQAHEVMNRLVYMAKTNKQDALAKDFEARYNVFARMLGEDQQQAPAQTP
ncbi:MAG: DUF2723 domain-containing protein [Bacteroidia bacterium]|nr:DUF2723 domain-containing protein [Bacteroidia bacterium]